MNRERPPTLDPRSVPEVAEYLLAKARLDAFKDENADIFDELTALVERYNATLEAAEKVVRAREASCGPFDCYSTSTSYDAEELFRAVGKERFAKLGGRMKTVFDLDAGFFEAALSMTPTLLPREVLERVRDISPRYHRPKKVVLP